MSDLSSYLGKRAREKSSENLLHSNEGLTIAATAGLGASHFYDIHTSQQFKAWEADFSEHFNNRTFLFEERRAGDLKEYTGLLDNYEISDYEGLRASDETLAMARNLHRDDIRSRWDFEQFFADDGNDGARRVLGYHHYENDQSAYKTYSDDQYRELSETGQVSVDGTTLEGHHVNDFSNHAADPELINQLYHASNVRLMTRTAHLYDPDYGHGGSFANPTTGFATELEDRHMAIIEANSDISDDAMEAFNIYSGLGIGVLAGTVTAIVQIMKYRDDVRPWKKKAAVVGSASLLRGVEAGTLALLALKTRSMVSGLGESDITVNGVELANSVFTSMAPGGLTSSIDAGNLAMYAGFSLGIAEFRILRSAISSIAIWRSTDSNTARHQFSGDTAIIFREETAFFSIAFIIDMLYDAGPNAFISDPTGGFILALRLVYSVGKVTYRFFGLKETVRLCKEAQLDTMYKLASSNLK